MDSSETNPCLVGDTAWQINGSDDDQNNQEQAICKWLEELSATDLLQCERLERDM